MKDELKQYYLEHKGAFCPYCESFNIQMFGSYEQFDADTIVFSVECYDCGEEWRDEYTLTDILDKDE